MHTRIALSALATFLFLALFLLQLGTSHGPILKSYLSTRQVQTPCKVPGVCPTLEAVYTPGDHDDHFTASDNETWRQYSRQWDSLCDKQCDCKKTVQYSRWYAFNTDFPCRDNVRLCSENANTTSLAFAMAVLSPEAPCFPVPVPDMAAASTYLTVRANKLNTLQNFTLTNATRNMVEVAGNKFCTLLKNMPVFELPASFPSLVSGQVLHMRAVMGLSDNLNGLTTTALSAA